MFCQVFSVKLTDNGLFERYFAYVLFLGVICIDSLSLHLGVRSRDEQ